MSWPRCLSDITHHNALRQSIIGIALLSVMPVMTLIYASAMLWIQPDQITRNVQFAILASMGAQIAAGFLIILKYPRNIVKLREYIEKVASGTLPENVHLLDTDSSDDLKFIENGMNAIISEMRHQLEQARKQANEERELREMIVNQDTFILQSAQHRAMIQSIAEACHHLGNPLTIMDLRLYLIKLIDRMPPAERKPIVECEQMLYEIMNIQEKSQRVEDLKPGPGNKDDGNEFRSLAM